MPTESPSGQGAEAIAERERRRVLHRDILGHRAIELEPLGESAASAELTRFAGELWRAPNMDGYFDRRHLANLRLHQHEALHGFATLASGGILEILSIPVMPNETMGFHVHSVFDPADDKDRGRYVGYAIWSLEKGNAPFGQADTVRMAFDIFPPFREGRFKKIPFTNHEIYNISRRVLWRFKPRQFAVDAATQIAQTRTGEIFKRTVYYLKRGYYPPDAKAFADRLLARIVEGITAETEEIQDLLAATCTPYWIFPVERYLKAPPAPHAPPPG
jgi:hypothetical protein